MTETIVFWIAVIVGAFAGGIVVGVVATEAYLRERPGRWSAQRELARMGRVRPRAGN